MPEPTAPTLLEFFLGRADATAAEMLVRGVLVGCSLFMCAQLLAMLATRWGERNALGKSLLLSLLIHLCLGLGWSVVLERSPVGAATTNSSSELRTPVESDSQFLSRLPEEESQDTAAQNSVWRTPAPRQPQYRSRTTPAEELVPFPEPPDFESRITAPRDLQTPDFRRADDPALEGLPLSEPSEPFGPMQPATTEIVAEPLAPLQRNPGVARQRARLSPQPIAAAAAPQATTSTAVAPRPPEEVMAATPPGTALQQPRPLPQPLAANNDPVVGRAPAVTTRRALDQVQSLALANRDSTASRSDEVTRARPTLLTGKVTDAATGKPLEGSTVRFDRAGAAALTAVTSATGQYELTVTETPDNFAVTAFHTGYVPESRNVRGQVERAVVPKLDFALKPSSESVIAVEREPQVHHLGNDKFEGRINSQFQREAEGEALEATFRVTPEQSRLVVSQAAITFMAKGLQCAPVVELNGTLLRLRSGRSPDDGVFGLVIVPFDPKLLKPGENQIRLEAVSCNGDLDDFEFVNVQIRLSRKK